MMTRKIEDWMKRGRFRVDDGLTLSYVHGPFQATTAALQIIIAGAFLHRLSIPRRPSGCQPTDNTGCQRSEGFVACEL